MDWKGKNWYRFIPPAGTNMPNKAVGVHHCGTKNPGWIHGYFPTKLGETVEVRVCFAGYYWAHNMYYGPKNQKPCYYHTNAKIRHCGKYFIYELPDTPGCMRYCAV